MKRTLAALLAVAVLGASRGRERVLADGGSSPARDPAVAAGLQSPNEADREKALAAVEAYGPEDRAGCASLLPALADVLRRRGGAERARVAAFLLRIPGEEAVDLWWDVLDPEREHDDRVLAAAVGGVAARAGEPDFARRLLRHARDPREDPHRRALAIEALGGIDGPGVPLVLGAARPGADWVEESCRALALGRRGGPASVAPLLALLDHESVAVRVHAWESLVRVTGHDVAPKREAWEAWWGRQRGRLPAAVAAAPGDPYATPEPTHVPRYYDIPVRGRGTVTRVAFCLDVSASMSEKGIEPARRRLANTILELTTRHEFDVVAFNDRVTTWAGRLQRAHPIQKARAIAWCDAIVPKAYTNVYDAVETAFQYAGRGREPSREPVRLDAVYLLSDGAPNRGRYHVPKQVVAGIAALSEGRVPVHTIGVGESVLTLLGEIAAATGGTFVASPD